MPYYILNNGGHYSANTYFFIYETKYSIDEIMAFFEIATEGRGELIATTHSLEWRNSLDTLMSFEDLVKYYSASLWMILEDWEDYQETYEKRTYSFTTDIQQWLRDLEAKMDL